MSIIRKRYVIAILAFFGCMNLWWLHKYFKLSYDLSATRTYETLLAHQIALGFTCIGGIIANHFGGVLCFGIGIGVSTLINLLIIAAFSGNDVSLLGFLDFVDGLFQALAISAIPDIWSRWAPLNERSRLMIGTFVGFFFAPREIILASWFSYWKYFLYVKSGIILIWCAIWFYIVKNDPAQDASLHINEKQYLVQHTGLVDRPRRPVRTIPWSQIFKSKPFWALCIIGFILYTAVTFVSMYVPYHIIVKMDPKTKQVYQQTIITSNEEDHTMGLCLVAFFLILGFAADFARNKTNYNSTQIRKFYVCLGFLIGVAAFILIWTVAIDSLQFFLLFNLSRSFVEAAILVNVIDLSPNYSSILWGFVKTFMTLGHLLIKYYIVLRASESKYEWDVSFHLLEMLYIIGALLYYFLGSAELQLWNNVRIDVQELQKRRNNI